MILSPSGTPPPPPREDTLSPQALREIIQGIQNPPPTTPPTTPAVGVGATNPSATQEEVVDEGDTTLGDTAGLVRDTLDLFTQPDIDQDEFDAFMNNLERYNQPVFTQVMDNLEAMPTSDLTIPPRAEDFFPPTDVGEGRTRTPTTTQPPTTPAAPTQPPPLVTTPARGRGRGRGRIRGRGRRRTTTTTQSGRATRMNQGELQQQLQVLLNDQRQTAAGRRIAGITTTNTITTTYKDGGRPQVRRTSTSVRN